MTADALRARLRAPRGQGGFVVITALAVWLLVGGAVMIALLNMTLSVSNQARLQAESAQQTRAVDGALETAIVQIQIDPSGRIGQPTGNDDGSCEAGLANPGDELEVDLSSGTVTNLTRSTRIQATLLPPTILRVIEDGGLMEHVKRHGDLPVS